MLEQLKYLAMAAFVVGVVFSAGYLRGEDAEANRHIEEVAKLKDQLKTVTFNYKAVATRLEAKLNETVQIIERTPDTTGCADTDAPAAIVDSLRQ